MAIWTNRIGNSIPKSASDELISLADNAERLNEFIEAAGRHKAALTPAEAIGALSKELSIDGGVLRQIFNGLENLKNLSDEFGTPEKVLNELAGYLSDAANTKIEQKKSIIISAVEKYQGDNSVTISYKAQRLTYLRENIYQEAEIITDTRPVFDAKGERVIEYLVTHSLVVTYFHQGRLENIHLAMDAADVLKLRKGCDRAMIKAKAIKAELGEKARILREEDGIAN